ncbi:hypothetical protein PoB_003433000 [Plakobranchus ocellatus]|uniref:Uncharacterized protein n=1 Tax=Plakobranchus ocellatus TaxID=259542 RepID=A0AAV4AI22_9GAST|nr:hypothetical protein PoB_003433000 [Plakobranchus ocellatus]
MTDLIPIHPDLTQIKILIYPNLSQIEIPIYSNFNTDVDIITDLVKTVKGQSHVKRPTERRGYRIAKKKKNSLPLDTDSSAQASSSPLSGPFSSLAGSFGIAAPIRAANSEAKSLGPPPPDRF